MTWRNDYEMPAMAKLFLAAAMTLTDQAARDGDAAKAFLAQLGYLDGVPEKAPHRAALLRAAAGFRRIFTIPSGDAPALLSVGAEVVPGQAEFSPTSVAGSGLAFGRAFEACVGEGVEHLSQYLRPSDPIVACDAAAALVGADRGLLDLCERLRPFERGGCGARRDWAQAASLATGEPVLVPADLCFRRPAAARELDVPWPLGTGCAAGADHLDATLHALFELIERDAVASWWRGGRGGYALQPGIGAERLATLRRGAGQRVSWLLDISGELGVPVVVAASCDPSGYGLCCGFAARATVADAADAALLEMAQIELGYRLAAQKRQLQGEAALNEGDRRHIARFTNVAVAQTPALHPVAPPRRHAELPAEDPLALLAALRARLAASGLQAYAVDLTRAEYDIPVVRVLCPGLQASLAGTDAATAPAL